MYFTAGGGLEVATENIERTRMTTVYFGLNVSKELSPPGQGHCRKGAASIRSQKLNFLGYVPIHKFSARAREFYEGTYNDGVREAKVDRLGALDALDLFGRKRDF